MEALPWSLSRGGRCRHAISVNFPVTFTQRKSKIVDCVIEVFAEYSTGYTMLQSVYKDEGGERRVCKKGCTTIKRCHYSCRLGYLLSKDKSAERVSLNAPLPNEDMKL